MNAIRFTSSPWGFRQTPLEEQCKYLQSLGIDFLCSQFLTGFPGLLPEEMTQEQIERTLELVRRFGLRYASFNAGGDFMLPADKVQEQVRLCRKQIDMAAKFSPEVIIVFAGWQKREDEGVYTQVTDCLGQVSRHAAEFGLTVALENHGGLTATVEQCNRILSAVNEPNIGLNYDPANFAMYGQDPLDALVRLDAPVVFTHFKSLRADGGGKSYCRIGDGVIDYVPILRRLRDRYHGFYALEYEEPDDVFEGTGDDYQTLRTLMKQAGF